MKKTTALIFFLLVMQLNASVKGYFALYGIPKDGKKVLTVINGFDCLNCYKGISLFLES